MDISYCIKSWHEDSRRDDSTVMFSHERKCLFGKIIKIFEVAHDFKLIVETLECEKVNDSILLPGLYKITGSAPIIVIKFQDILEQCILMHMYEIDFISTTVDPFERE